MIEKERYFLFKDLCCYNDVVHFFSKKPLNFYKRIVDDGVILNNYGIISRDFNYNFDNIKECKQSHSNNIIILNEGNASKNYFENADGIITNLRGIPIITYFADCIPILIYDPVKNAIGNIHSGWKGTSLKIIVKAINAMIDNFNCDIRDIKVYFGPSIQKCCFEVSSDVFDIFKNNFDNIDEYIKMGNIVDGENKYYIDTVGINSKLLLECGIIKENIFYSNVCTKCNFDKLFSYRSSSDNNGRNISLICLKEKI